MWIEKKYIMMLSSSLERYKQKSSELWNFRCPHCHDSAKNKAKARGYLFVRKGKYFYHCHNCSITQSFKNFLKFISPMLYEQYILEKFSENKPETIITFEVKKPIFYAELSGLKKISQLSPFSIAKKFIVERQIPTPFHAKLYYVDKFKEWVNSIIPNKFESLDHDSARIIIPIFDNNKTLIGFQGRAISKKDNIRYITIMLNEEAPRIYGLDCVDFNRKNYVFEGPFDSMFIPNSIATCGGQLTSELKKLNKSKDNTVVVYDNEPRSKEIVKNMLTAIKNDYKICIWPDNVIEKDINEMILKKVSGHYVKTEIVNEAAKKIQNIIDENTFSGLSAELRLSQWKKV